MTTLDRPIRVSTHKIENLKNSIHTVDKDAKIYLFGSRIDVDKRGGDIDIIILSDILDSGDIRDVRLNFFKEFGEQKLDIILDMQNPLKTFTKIALKEAVEL